MVMWEYEVVRMDTLDLFKGHVELLGRQGWRWSMRSTPFMTPKLSCEDRMTCAGPATTRSHHVASGSPFSGERSMTRLIV